MKNRIYLDHAATTPVSKTVLEAMLPFFTEIPGNASAVYATGREARKAVEAARKQTAAAIGAEPREICFTSGGSESDNQAIIGIAFALKDKGKPFNPTAQAEADTISGLEERQIGGLGIHLIRNIMDQMEYRREADSNVLIMTKNIN